MDRDYIQERINKERKRVIGACNSLIEDLERSARAMTDDDNFWCSCNPLQGNSSIDTIHNSMAVAKALWDVLDRMPKAEVVDA